MNDQYLVLTNDQSPIGMWTIFVGDRERVAVWRSWSADDTRRHLCELNLESVSMDVDGNGSIRQVPVEWIGDGEKLIGSDRALALV